MFLDHNLYNPLFLSLTCQVIAVKKAVIKQDLDEFKSPKEVFVILTSLDLARLPTGETSDMCLK